MNSTQAVEHFLVKSVLEEHQGSCDEDMFVTYRHYRVLDEDQLEIEAKGGVTFCIAAEPDSKLLHVAVAECSSKDLYNKDIGRQVALGRFVKIGEYVSFEWNREITIAQNLEAVWLNYFYHIRNELDELELTVKSCYLED